MTENEIKALNWIRNIKNDIVLLREESILTIEEKLGSVPIFLRNEINVNAQIIERSLTELDEYRSIGTVSECQEAVEKKKEKKPIEEKGVYASGQSDYICPSCGDSVIILDPECQAYKLGYCASCGQHLDWTGNP